MGKFIVMPPLGVQRELRNDGTPEYKDIRDATHWRVVNKLTNELAAYAETEPEAERIAADLNQG